MNDRVRTALAFGLIIVILLIWNILSRPGKDADQALVDSLDTGPIEEPAEIIDTLQTVTMPENADTIVIDRTNFKVVLSSAGGSVKEFYLKEYSVNIIPEHAYIFVTRLSNKKIPAFTSMISGDSVIFTHTYNDKIFTKVYDFSEPYGFRIHTENPDNSAQLLSIKAGLSITEVKNKGEDLRHFNVYVMNEKVEQLKKKIKDEFVYPGDIKWFALRTKYFALVIDNLGKIDTLKFYKLPKDDATQTSMLMPNNGRIDAAVFGCFYMRGGGDRFGAEIIGMQNINIRVLVLPVKYAELKKFKEGYEQMASGGIMGPIARIILWVFNLLYSLFKNYGFAIMFFAIIVKLIFFPLSRKMIESQQKMQMIQPELKKIQQKYKDDPQRLNQEMMQLYKTYKVNPFGGCLPLLVQMPIFFALYQTLISSIEFRQAPFIFWITDLSIKDPLYILPIVMGVIMLIQSLMTSLDPRQRFMVIIMPIFMVFIFLNFPSGLQLYWFSYNILTLIEHIIIKRGGMK